MPAAETTFDAIRARLRDEPGVEEGSAFHSPGLKVDGKIFAMLVKDELVFKNGWRSSARARPTRCSLRTKRWHS